MPRSIARWSWSPSAGGLAAAFIVVALLVAGPMGLDTAIREALRSHHTPWLSDIFGWVTHLGEGWVLGLTGASLAALGYYWGSKGLIRPGWLSIPALIVSGLVTRALKIGLGRPRPGLVDQGLVEWAPSLFVSDLHSFPSGHATSAFTFAAIFGTYFPAWRIALYGMASVVAFSRVVVGAHFFSDVVGGGLVGWLVGRGAVLLAERRWPPAPVRQPE